MQRDNRKFLIENVFGRSWHCSFFTRIKWQNNERNTKRKIRKSFLLVFQTSLLVFGRRGEIFLGKRSNACHDCDSLLGPDFMAISGMCHKLDQQLLMLSALSLSLTPRSVYIRIYIRQFAGHPSKPDIVKLQ